MRVTTSKSPLVQIPKLHPGQEELWDVYFSNRYKNIIVDAGRRWGKSKACLTIAIEEAVNNGKKVWWVAPTYKVLGNQWRDAREVLKGVYSSKSEQDKRLEFYRTTPDKKELRGEISFRSADTPDNLRGDGIDLLILDEAAFQNIEVYKILRPATVDTKGKIIFISTPNGHNWFYTFFERGKEENRERYPRWWSAQFTSYDNPFLDPQELDDAKEDMTEIEFRVEHLAEFIDDINKVFPFVYESATGVVEEPSVHGRYSIGIDLGRKHDATVMSVIDIDTASQIALYRFVGKDWELQKKTLSELLVKWHPAHIWADCTGVGQPVVEDLQKTCPYKITPFVLTPVSKPPLIQNLAVKFQNKTIRILEEKSKVAKVQIEELLAYEVKMSKTGNNWSYSAPRGGKDDTVIALALAAQALNKTGKGMSVIKNIFYEDDVKEKPVVVFERNTIYRKESLERKRALLQSRGLL